MNLINYILSRTGYVVARETTVRNYVAESYIDAIWAPCLQPKFYVNTGDFYDFFGKKFFDCHYITATIRQYQKNKNLKYEESALKDYYDNFQPQNWRDVWFNENPSIKSEGLKEYFLPWDIQVKKNDLKLPYSGPMTEKEGKSEFTRIKKVYDSIEKYGYIIKKSSNLYNSNNIQGYFLQDNAKYRFIALHGKHRLASLIVLEYEKIPVTFDLLTPRVITTDSIDYWPQVLNGSIDKTEALKIWNKIFDKNI